MLIENNPNKKLNLFAIIKHFFIYRFDAVSIRLFAFLNSIFLIWGIIGSIISNDYMLILYWLSGGVIMTLAVLISDFSEYYSDYKYKRKILNRLLKNKN